MPLSMALKTADRLYVRSFVENIAPRTFCGALEPMVSVDAVANLAVAGAVNAEFYHKLTELQNKALINGHTNKNQ